MYMAMIASAYRASRVLYNFLKSNFDGCSKLWLLPANICDCVPETFDEAGVRYEYVDISAETWCMDFVQVIDSISHYAGLLYVHTYGVEDTPLEMFAELKRRNPQICIIDDRCLCTPENQMHAEQIADVELYSTGSKKQVNMHGGGYAIISDGWKYKEYAMPEEEKHSSNWEYDWDVLKTTKAAAEKHKAEIFAIYEQLLSASVRMSEDLLNWRYNILVENRDEILKAIFDAGLFASAHYKPQGQGMPNCAYLHQHVINLFEDEYISIEQAKKICEIINEKTGHGV